MHTQTKTQCALCKIDFWLDLGTKRCQRCPAGFEVEPSPVVPANLFRTAATVSADLLDNFPLAASTTLSPSQGGFDVTTGHARL